MGVTAAKALAYLPAGTPLHARLYLEIKPLMNSFVFTGRDSPSLRERAMEAGASAWVLKGGDLSGLLDELGTALNDVTS